jgi:hypothetical protein
MRTSTGCRPKARLTPLQGRRGLTPLPRPDKKGFQASNIASARSAGIPEGSERYEWRGREPGGV